MLRRWPVVELGEVLHLCLDSVKTDPSATYDIAGVYSFGRGLLKREPLLGTDTTYKYFNRLHADDFIISQPKAWEGAISAIPPEYEGWFVSPVFSTFRAETSKVDIRYLDWFCKQPRVWDSLRNKSRGMGARRETVSPDKFLTLQIPLPALSEQRRIISRLEQLVLRTEDAKAITNKLEQESKAFVFSCVNEISSAASYITMKEVSPVIRRPVDIEPSRNYPELGIRSFGKGTFHKPSIKGSELGSKRIFSIEPGDLLFSNVFAWEGAIAVAQKDDKGRYGSHRFITCVPDPARAKAEFLCSYFLTEEGIENIGAASPGGAGRNRTLNIKKLETIEVPVPDIRQQEIFCSLLAGIQSAQAERRKLSEAICSIIPSLLQKVFDT